MHTTERRIFRLLYNNREPLSGYVIARKLDTQISSTYYFLDKMVKKNVLVKFEVEAEKGNKSRSGNFYGLNPLFFKPNLWEDIIGQFTEIIKRLEKYNGNTDFGLPDPEYTLELVASILLEK